MAQSDGPARAAALAHATSCYPDESCGLLLQDPKVAEMIYWPSTNRQSEDPIADPSGKQRSAQRAFHLDGRDLVRARRQGLKLIAIVHSHPDHPAHFSAMDRDVATYRWEDEPPQPTYPGVLYWVISVREGAVDDDRWFHWSNQSLDFEEVAAP